MFRTALLTALATVLALPAPSLAKDPLLSGYAAPGGGEQVLLGSRLLGGGGGSGGSGSSAAPTGAGGAATATQGSLRVPAPAAGSGAAPSSSAPATSGSAAKGGDRRGTSGGGHASTENGSTASTAPTAAPRPVAYPTRADDAGGFPLSAGELLVGALALAGIAGMAAWLRRIAPHGGGPDAQASA